MNAPDRRDFARTLVALAAAPLVLPFDAAAAQAGADPMAIGQALAEVVRLRFGKYLTDDQLKDVRRELIRLQRGADLLRQVKLQNGDEPAVTFRADVP